MVRFALTDILLFRGCAYWEAGGQLVATKDATNSDMTVITIIITSSLWASRGKSNSYCFAVMQSKEVLLLIHIQKSRVFTNSYWSIT